MPKSVQKKVKKKFGGKSYQSCGQSRQRIKLGVTALIFLVALIIISKLLGVIISLNRPYSPENSVGKEFNWGGKGRLNIVVKADKLYLLSFDPGAEFLDIVKIPDQAYLQLPLGFGQWQASSVYGLGQSEKPAIGATLLKKTMTTSLGIPVDNYLIINDQIKVKPFEETLETIRQNPTDGLALLVNSKTDLTPLEYGKLWWRLRGLRGDKIKMTDLMRGDSTSWLLLSDGSRVLNLNQDRLDQFIQNNLIDSKLRDEGLTIGVFNGTKHSGMAEKVAREISNMGGRVIFTTNSPVKIRETAVFGRDSSYTSDRLSQIFAPRCARKSGLFGLFGSRTNCSSVLTGVESSRADINVVVGDDFYLQFNRPESN